MTEPKAITFEKGYLRLQEIAEEVNRAEVPVDRMGDLFAEGKGSEGTERRPGGSESANGAHRARRGNPGLPDHQ